MTSQLRLSMVAATTTLIDAMRSLEDSGSQIVLVVGDDDRLMGVLTDGDIRRAQLGGATLDEPVARFTNTAALTVDHRAGRADVLELMQARQIRQVPVVDNDHRVTGLHLLHELLSIEQRLNWAVVMAGGRGSRLGSMTDRVPKPMLQVAGRPILERIVLHLVGSGIRRIYLSVNYLSEVIEAHFGDGSRFGCQINYLHETEPLGTAGSLALLPKGADGPGHALLIMNGDLVTQADVGALIDFHEQGDQAVTMAVRRYFTQIPFGCVEVDDDQLTSFVEKPTISKLVNAGMYVLDLSCLDILTAGEPMAMPDLVQRARERGQVVRVREVDEDWIDVGRNDQLDQARRGE